MTPSQAKLYQFLLDRIDEPVSPSYDEMSEFMGFKGRSAAHRLIEGLVAQGRVEKAPNRARSIRAIRPASFRGIPSAALIQELKNRGEWPHGR